MKSFIGAVIFICVALSANAQLLWKVSGNGLSSPSYIMGTHHLAPLSVKDGITGLQKAMDETQQVYGELKMSVSFMGFPSFPSLGAPLWSIFPHSTKMVPFEKAEKYVRLHGSLNLAVGGQAHDVLHGIEAYGIVPEEVYPGLNYGYDKPNFDEIDAVIKAYADAVIKAGGKRSDSRLTTA